MNSFFELERYNAPLPGMVFREEQFRNYVIKWTRHDGHDGMWVFCEGKLKGSVQWTDMLTMSNDNNVQILMRYPNAFEGVLFAQWEPSPDATDADFAVALSRLQKMYVEVAPEDKHTGLLIYGPVSLDVGDDLDVCDLYIGRTCLAQFQADEGLRLIDINRIGDLAYCTDFETLEADDVQEAMMSLGAGMLNHLATLVPQPGTAIH